MDSIYQLLPLHQNKNYFRNIDMLFHPNRFINMLKILFLTLHQYLKNTLKNNENGLFLSIFALSIKK